MVMLLSKAFKLIYRQTC
ncbi:hypothetical protein LINGRAHAP2_LOCUS22748 [Linum grandiflorum]